MLLKNITQKQIQKVRLIQPHKIFQLNHQYCFHPENLDCTAKIIHILYPLSRRIMTYICIVDLTNSNSKNVIGIHIQELIQRQKADVDLNKVHVILTVKMIPR